MSTDRGSFNYVPPKDIDEAQRRLLVRTEEAQAIEVQLGELKRGTVVKEPLWHKRARWALHFRRTECRMLKAWMRTYWDRHPLVFDLVKKVGASLKKIEEEHPHVFNPQDRIILAMITDYVNRGGRPETASKQLDDAIKEERW